MPSLPRRVVALVSLVLSAVLGLAVLGVPAAADDAASEAVARLGLMRAAVSSGSSGGGDAGVSAAQAGGRCFSDPTGDTRDMDTDEPVSFPRADITQVCIDYGDTLALSVRVVEPTDPRTDPNWHGTTFVGWFIDVTGDEQGEYLAVYDLNEDAVFVAEVWEIGADEEDDPVRVCTGTPVYADGTHTASAIPPDCIGSPATVRVQAGMFYDSNPPEGPVLYDIAPSGAFSAPAGPDVPLCQAPAPAPFVDRDAIAEVHRANVDCLYELGITLGTVVDGQRFFNPIHDVTRGQFSGFLYRTLLVAGVPAPPLGPAFDDVPPGHTFEEEIRRLTGGQVLHGYADSNLFGPADPVRRDQTASILVRAAEYAAGATLAAEGSGYFADTAGNVHEDNIDIAFEQGFVTGLTAPSDAGPGTYGPADNTSRQQMASVLVRYLRTLES